MLKNISIAVVSFILSLLAIELGLQGYAFYMEQQRLRMEPSFEGKIRILTIGESTTDSIAADSKKAWPSYLEEMLTKEFPDKKFAVINKARAGTSTQFLIDDLPSHLKKYRPHLVISMMGLNDNSHLDYIHDQNLISKIKIVRILKSLTKNLDIEYLDENESFEINYLLKALQYDQDLTEPLKYKIAQLDKKSWQVWDMISMRYFHLSLSHGSNANYDRAFMAAKKSLAFNPHQEETIIRLIQTGLHRKKEVREVLISTLERGYIPTKELSNWLTFIDYQSDQKLKEMISKAGISNTDLMPIQKTKKNYLALHKLTKASQSTLAIMAYPTTNISAYKQLILSDKNDENVFSQTFYKDYKEVLPEEFSPIIFIENMNFPDHYDQKYYKDFNNFGGRKGFGHFTSYGHELVARNVLETLKKNWKTLQ